VGAIARFEQAFLALREQRPLSRSLVFTEASLMLGAGTSVAPMRRDGEGVETLDLSGEDRILALLTVAFSAPVNAAVLVKLRRASELWAQGDKSLAQIHLEHLRLPKLENGEQAFRLFLADQLIASGHSPRGLCKVLGFELPKGLRKFSPDQARDDHGRWTSGGAGGDAGSAEGSSARGASSRSHTYANGSAGANNNIILVSVEDRKKKGTRMVLSTRNEEIWEKKRRRKMNGMGGPSIRWDQHLSRSPGRVRPPLSRPRRNHPISLGKILVNWEWGSKNRNWASICCQIMQLDERKNGVLRLVI
jgi:hypothetical protein